MSLFQRLSSELTYLRGALRTLGRTTKIAKNPNHTIRELAEEQAAKYGARTFISSDRESLSYAQFNARANLYARWFRAQGLVKGDVVGLLMPNRVEYLCVWFGIAKAGGVTALLNTNLMGVSLAHCMTIVGMTKVIVDPALLPAYESAKPHLGAIEALAFGENTGGYPRIDIALQGFSEADIPADERVPLTTNDRCVFVYTSGTTGLPKAANLNHYRVQLAMQGFAGATAATERDRVYDALPMYHTNGGVCAPGIALTTGGSIFIREKFSAREFFPDMAAQGCTIFIYIGELCRYVLESPPGPADRAHKVRACVGNGLRPDIWEAFRDRFGLARIIEFYGSTEGNVAIVNYDSKPGAVGRIPKWAESRFAVKLARFDITRETPVRGTDGLCIECEPGEIGEALGEILNDPARPTNRFEGYADKAATEKKILRDAFVPGDAWFRTGDLMKKDALGYFYFIDRIGDTYRWKGENVSTTEVSEAISAFSGVKEVTVYGVATPKTEGRAGMAALAVDDPAHFDLDGFRAYIVARLPEYARPVFLRFQDHLDITGTFKQRKGDLVGDGFDPGRSRDALYFNDAKAGRFTPLDAALYARIGSGEVRL